MLYSENERHLLKGEIYYLLSPFLKKGIPYDQLIDAISPDKVELAEVYYALSRLEEKGYIECIDESLSPEVAIFCSFGGTAEKDAAHRLKTRKLYLCFLDCKDNGTLKQHLNSLGISLTEHPEQSHLFLIITDDFFSPKLKEINRLARSLRRPWILLQMRRETLWLASFAPDKIGCWECLAFKLKNRFLDVHKNAVPDFLPNAQSLAFHLVAIETLKRITLDSDVEGHLFSFNVFSLESKRHPFFGKPQCSGCSEKSQEKGEPSSFDFTSRKKTGGGERRWRIKDDKETFRQLSSHIDPLTGIIPFITPIHEDSSSPAHVYTAGWNFALGKAPSPFYGKSCRSSSSGKGQTDMQAKVGSICEAIERYSGIFQGDEPHVQGSYIELISQAIHLNELLLFSDDQFQKREEWNQHCHRFHKIPLPFNEKAIFDWSPVWSYTEKRHKYIPSGYCYFGVPDFPYCSANSNGSAAGNCLEEATLQGLFELIERDAVAIWWYHRIERAVIDLPQEDRFISELIAYYESRERDVWALDITSDLQIPTVAAITKKRTQTAQQIMFGFGTHLDPRIALQRALCEMHQLCMSLPIGEIAGEIPLDAKIEQDWLFNERIENHLFLLGNNKILHKKISDFQKVDHDDLYEDIQYCQKIIEAKGMELLLLDQSRADINLKVVKVIVPGLRLFHPRFAKGRLYDVPLQMGWVKDALSESQLNSSHLFI